MNNNRKTENRMGVRFGQWQGVVVSIDDPLKAGRVQIRIYSDNDDKTNCSDSSLFWSHPASPIQSASLGHKGWSPTGMRVGSTVHGTYGDLDKQIPFMENTQYRASIGTPGSGDWTQVPTPDGVNDISPAARGIGASGVQGEKNFGADLFYGSNPVSLYNLATDATLGGGGNSVPQSYQKMKSGGLPTIANTAFQSGQKILNIINQIDPQNSAGAVKSALQGMIALKNLTSAATSMSGGDQFSSLFNSILQQATSSSGSPQAIQSLVSTLINSPSSVPVGNGTQDNSLLNSSQQSGSGGKSSQIASMAQQIIQQLISSFTGAGDTGGLATYDQNQGALVKMEQAVKQLFSNMSDSPQNPGTQSGSTSDSNS